MKNYRALEVTSKPSNGLNITLSQSLNVCFILLGIVMAVRLFNYGIQVPFEFRLRGDAYAYMNIASHFTSLHEAWSYVGDRAPGFPWFDYLFLMFDNGSSWLSRVNHICWALFILHQLTSLWVCFVCVKSRLFKASSLYFGLLFLALAAYPVMVMHTTTPLTDVFGMDLLLIGFSPFAWVTARKIRFCKTAFAFIVAGLFSGVLLGYAILVRPAYWIGVSGFLVMYMFMTVVNYFFARQQSNLLQSILMTFVTLLALVAMVLPVMEHCKARYHAVCILDPHAVDSTALVLNGLGSARTVWSFFGKDAPYYPDDFLVNHFKNRCPITSITGSLHSANTNLVSCLYHAPHLSVVYFVKKLTGLFDPFRMTPYTERLTPAWYVWIARSFSSIAFAGFWILLWEGVKAASLLIVYRKPVSSLTSAVWLFCMIQASVHSILHVEERYALPWIPFCMIAIFLKIKSVHNKNYSPKLRWMWGLFIALVIVGYFIQVRSWDYGMG